jgi:beta-glucanase (GH16 family)
VAAFWLIGFEETPEQSAEICVFELKGHNIGTHSSVIGYGLHPFGDPNLEDDFFEEEFPIDVADYHTYAAEWEPGHVHFLVDGVLVRSIDQAPDYPMQLMLNLYDLAGEPDHTAPPMEFWVDYVRGTSGGSA